MHNTMPGRLVHVAVVVATVLTAINVAHAQTDSCPSPQAEAYLDINNVRARLFNNGNLFWRGSPHVYEVPKGQGIQAGFVLGLMLGGFVDGELRTAAARYGNYEYWAGPIDESTGLPDGECGVYDRMYRVSRADVAAYERGDDPTDDLLDWPTGLGAPTLTSDGSLVDMRSLPLADRATRKIDLSVGERPAFTGDQMVWWIMNDVAGYHRETETPPIGMEVQVTAFAFDVPGPLHDATFYRYRLVYRGSSPLTDAIVGLYNDVDLGSFDDDYVGSDTLLGLGFAYNGDNFDNGVDGYGEAPPAVGLDFVRGPLVPGQRTDGGSVRSGSNSAELGMTAFINFYGGGSIYGDPNTASDFYNYARGRWKDGSPITVGGLGVDDQNEPTSFSYPGDPVTGSFWSERNVDGFGTANQPADRAYMMGTGPFSMQPGEEQEIVVAIVWARGRDHLDSVTQLRRADRVAQAVADADFDVTVPTLDPPILSAAPSNGAVSLKWSNADSSNNVNDAFMGYSALVDASYALEGYDVYSFASASDSSGIRLATYDRVNAVRRVIDSRVSLDASADTSRFIAAEGNDTGLAHEHFVGGLDNHRTYHFGVQAYAYQGGFSPKVIRSKMARISVEPRRNYAVIDSTSGAFDIEALLDAMGIVPNPYMASSAYEVRVGNGGRGGENEVRFVNVPAGSSIRVFTLGGSLIKTLRQVGGPGDSGGSGQSMIPPQSVHWDLTNEAGRRISGGVYLVHVDVPGVGQRVMKFSMVAGD